MVWTTSALYRWIQRANRKSLPPPGSPIDSFADISPFVIDFCKDLFPAKAVPEVTICTREEFSHRFFEYREISRTKMFDLLPEEERNRIGYGRFSQFAFQPIRPWLLGGFYSSFTRETVVLNRGVPDTIPLCVHEISHKIFSLETGLYGTDDFLAKQSSDETLASEAGLITRMKLESIYGKKDNSWYAPRVEEFKGSFQQAVANASLYSRDKGIEELIAFAKTISPLRK